MRLAPMLLATLSLPVWAQAPTDPKAAGDCWVALGSRLPVALRTALADTAAKPNKRPPMEILVKPPVGTARPGGELQDGSEPQAALTSPPEQILEPKDLFLRASIELYSRAQARILGAGLVSPTGAPLKFHHIAPVNFISRSGLSPMENAGYLVLAESKGTRWYFRFSLLGPNSAWDGPAECSEDGLKLRALILAGAWAGAFDVGLRKAVRRSSPDEPILLGLDLLEALNRPAGKEARIQETAARLAALVPRNPDALSLCAGAYLATGKPVMAAHLKAWIAEMKPLVP